MNITSFAVRGLAAAALCGGLWAAPEPEFTDSFPIADCRFASRGGNPYFLLTPGRQLHFNNFQCVADGDCDEEEELVITVLHETRSVSFALDGEQLTVNTRVVEEYEQVDGEVAEISRNFFAVCRDSGDVYYFGEDVDNYEDGEVVNHEGSWLAGEGGALPGIIMPGGAFLLGARYFQEVAPGIALDRAEHVEMGLAVAVPAGAFEDCVRVAESTPLERKALSTKVYCPGTGLVIDDDMTLIFVLE